uniref:Alpha-1,3-mannosyl-glycoprotein 2-beta-N-acetylglucosaminyltransferase n=1 Tax=Plectus sambesii TaxID=2011161 RepID=A0A914VHJ9_9BILA
MCNHVNAFFRLRPAESEFPVVVSQDCCHDDTKEAILAFNDRITFIEHPDQRKQAGYKSGAKNYFLISQHYRWALDHVFMTLQYEHAIITEDDLDIADDFFSYFLSLRRLLREDETIWCISAWNDNGGDTITDRRHSESLYRTDFFPGLGWMLQRKLWLELRESWPEAFWDDWLRHQDVRKGRSCVRPEVSRTAHNMLVAGKGSSNGMYKNYLSGIHLPDEAVDFAKIDISYLLKNNYDQTLKSSLESARLITFEELNKKPHLEAGKPVRFPYETPRQFRELAAHFGLMKDIRSGMPRTAYDGIVTFYFNDARAYLYPAIDSFAYNETWDDMNRYLEFAELFCRPGRYTGKCDPKDPEMIAWFAKRKQSKRLSEWKNLIVN